MQFSHMERVITMLRDNNNNNNHEQAAPSKSIDSFVSRIIIHYIS